MFVRTAIAVVAVADAIFTHNKRTKFVSYLVWRSERGNCKSYLNSIFFRLCYMHKLVLIKCMLVSRRVKKQLT